MKTFFYGLQKCIKSKKITYPDDPFEPCSINNYDVGFINVSIYIYIMINDIHNILKKTKEADYN